MKEKEDPRIKQKETMMKECKHSNMTQDEIRQNLKGRNILVHGAYSFHTTIDDVKIHEIDGRQYMFLYDQYLEEPILILTPLGLRQLLNGSIGAWGYQLGTANVWFPKTEG